MKKTAEDRVTALRVELECSQSECAQVQANWDGLRSDCERLRAELVAAEVKLIKFVKIELLICQMCRRTARGAWSLRLRRLRWR